MRTIKRRNFLAARAAARPRPNRRPRPAIKDVTVIATAPAGLRLSVVKITTDQDGLYGYGCATFTQRAELVNAAVEKYLRPFLIGKRADRIEDIWQPATTAPIGATARC
jgi:mannonate dehydratase